MKILWELKILWEMGSRRAKILWDFVSQCEVWHVCTCLFSKDQINLCIQAIWSESFLVEGMQNSFMWPIKTDQTEDAQSDSSLHWTYVRGYALTQIVFLRITAKIVKIFSKSIHIFKFFYFAVIAALFFWYFLIDLIMKLIDSFYWPVKVVKYCKPNCKTSDKPMHMHFLLYQINRKITLFVSGF